jgi:hypothetical protein
MLPRTQLLKAEKWWDSEPPLMLAFAYYQLSLAKPAEGFVRAVAALALFGVAIVGVAGFGHLLNDLCDLEPDRLTGAHNLVRDRSRAYVAGQFAVVLVFSVTPWLWLPTSPYILALLALEFILFVAYSVPPIRLKARGLLGAIADAMYAFVVPIAVAMLVFGQLGHRTTPLWLALLVCAWMSAVGLRRILTHQLAQVSRDQRSADGTFAVRRGWLRTYRLLGVPLAPAEVGLMVVALVALGTHAPLLPLGFALYAGWTLFFHRRRPTLALPSPLPDLDRIMMLNNDLMSQFQIEWLPLLTLLTLAARRPVFLILLGAHLLLFDNGFGTLLRWHLPELRRYSAGRRWAV